MLASRLHETLVGAPISAPRAIDRTIAPGLMPFLHGACQCLLTLESFERSPPRRSLPNLFLHSAHREGSSKRERSLKASCAIGSSGAARSCIVARSGLDRRLDVCLSARIAGPMLDFQPASDVQGGGQRTAGTWRRTGYRFVGALPPSRQPTSSFPDSRRLPRSFKCPLGQSILLSKVEPRVW